MHQNVSITIDLKLLTFNSWKTVDFDECLYSHVIPMKFLQKLIHQSISNIVSSLEILYPHLTSKVTMTRGISQMLDQNFAVAN
jgi:uncharacterized membrane protein YcfT